MSLNLSVTESRVAMADVPLTGPPVRRFGVITAGLTGLLGLIGLAQWVLHARVAMQPAGASPMKANTGLCLLLLGAAAIAAHLAPDRTGTRRFIFATFTATAVFGGLAYAGYVVHLNSVVDELFLRLEDPTPGIYAGRMSMLTAGALVALALALVIRNVESRGGRRPSELLCFVVLAAMVAALIGQVVGAQLLFGAVGPFPGMGIETVAALILLCAAILSLHPDRGALATFTAGGTAGREARVAVIIVGPLTIGVVGLVLLGYRASWYDLPTATALAFVFVILVGLTATWHSFTQLVHAERVVRDAVVDARRNEARFRIAFESAPSGMLLIDEAGTIMLANGRAAALFGFSGGDLIGRQVESLVPGRFRQPPAGSEVMPAPTGFPLGAAGATTILRQDGGELPAEVCLNPVRTAEGQLLLLTVLDVTSRRRNEEAIIRLNAELRASEGRFALAVNGSHNGIWDWDSSTGHLWCSIRIYEQCGWHPDRHPSVFRHWLRRVHPDDRDAALAELRAHFRREGPFDVEVRIKSDAGTYRWFRIRGEALFDGAKPLRMAGSLTDVTDFKQTLHWLKESERRLRVALDNHRVGLWQWHLPTDEILCDANWRSVHEWSQGRDSPTRDEWLAGIHPDDRPGVEAAMNGHEANPNHTFEVEYRTRTAAGRLAWICTRGRVVQWGADGRPSRLMGTVESITEWKRVESLLEARNRELENLLYVTSHDLREPLRAVLGFSRIVEERYQTQLDDDGRDYLARVSKAANRLDRLLGEIWTLSRVRRIDRPTAAVDMRELVRNAVSQLDERIRETGASVQIGDGFGAAPVHPTWFTQAIYNLVLNGLKFVRPGEPPAIEVEPWTTGEGSIGVVVRDRGPGVAPEHAERIFRLFQRAVGREVEGTGAGLAIVREIAERHGGRAWVQSRAGGGSEFIMTFADTSASRNN